MPARRPRYAFGLSARHRSDFAAEISVGPINALAQRIAHEARDLDGAADFAFDILERRGNALGGIMNIGLLQQTDLLVERLEPGLDNLGDRRLGLALLAEL